MVIGRDAAKNVIAQTLIPLISDETQWQEPAESKEVNLCIPNKKVTPR